MITTPTVLVLGAGASVDFGYPTGPKLKQNILNTLERHLNTARHEQLFYQLGYSEADIARFRDALFHAGTKSIDTFLEQRGKNFMNIGKQAIAYHILKNENDGTLFSDISPITKEANWYQYLFEKMYSPLLENFGSNRISFVTFNYDRSLEHYLFTALKNLYGEIDEAIATVLKNFHFIHVHGHIGHLPWQGQHGRPYRATANTNLVAEAAKGIHVMSEKDAVENNFRPAIYEIQEAERVIFLGFHFHPDNLERLSINPEFINKRFSGTSYGLTRMEEKEIEVSFTQRFGVERIQLSSAKILEFLRAKEQL